jgi:hypothetical protein
MNRRAVRVTNPHQGRGHLDNGLATDAADSASGAGDASPCPHRDKEGTP